MNEAATRQMARQRGEAYGLLVTLFADPLDADVIDRVAARVSDGGMRGSFADELLAVFLHQGDSRQLADRLAVDHARLFRGVHEAYGPLPPYESLWREGQLMGDSTMGVAASYAAAGYEPEGRFTPCDHIAEELRFMSSLCQTEYEAWQAGCPADVRHARYLQRWFIDRHLSRWVEQYCRQLTQKAQEPLYQKLAHTTATVLEQDALQLRGDA